MTRPKRNDEPINSVAAALILGPLGKTVPAGIAVPYSKSKERLV